MRCAPELYGHILAFSIVAYFARLVVQKWPDVLVAEQCQATRVVAMDTMIIPVLDIGRVVLAFSKVPNARQQTRLEINCTLIDGIMYFEKALFYYSKLLYY